MVKIQLHVEKYEIMINRRGRTVRWEKAILCSCWNVDSQQPAYHCKACQGLGYTYEDPQDCLALVMGITSSKAFEEMAGAFETGDMVMTIPKRIPAVNPTSGLIDKTMKTATINPMFDIGANDRVTLLDDTMPYSEILRRGIPIGNRESDTLTQNHIARIDKLRKNDPITGIIKEYTPGVDYELDGRTVRWLDGGESPFEGDNYSIMYRYYPTYTVLPIELPKARHQDGQDLPRYVALRFLSGGVDNE